MSQENRAMMETLESRTLMSAATLGADQRLLQAALVQFQEHQKNAAFDIAGARQRAMHDGPINDPSLKPLLQTLRADKIKRNNQFFAGTKALHAAIHADNQTIFA